MCQNLSKKFPLFDLTINLVEKELWKIKEEDEDILDLPVAYLTYDSRKEFGLIETNNTAE